MLQIGSHSFGSPLILAPLAGYSDLPFRLLCKRYGAGFCVSEMISSHGLVYRQKNTLRMLQSVEKEKPVSFQIFGADQDIMAEAAEILAGFTPDMIDINMGCPVKKVTKKGAGAALMSNPNLAKNIIKQVVRKVSVPVTVKFRSGINSKELNAVEFAKMSEDAGAAAVAVHARTWGQAFSGIPDYSIIRDVKKSVTIPVIGNGDIHSTRNAAELMETTGCDGVMIGRAALGNPWVFSAAERPANMQTILEGAREHLVLMEQFLPVEKMLGYVKNHMCRYFRDLPGSVAVRKSILSATDLAQLRHLFDTLSNRTVKK